MAAVDTPTQKIQIMGAMYEVLEVDFDEEDEEGYHDALLRNLATGEKEWWTLDANELI